MKSLTTSFTRTALAGIALLSLGASVLAGPAPRYMMVDGQLMELKPVKKDVKLANGCQICVSGQVIDPKGNPTKIKNGQFVTAEGTLVTTPSRAGHGG